MSTHEYDVSSPRSRTLVDLVRAVEAAAPLDRLSSALAPVADALVADPARRDALRGSWLGHAVHPMLTDVPIGLWTATNVLDLVGGAKARPAARRLLSLGLVAAVPTAVTGLAEWAGTGVRERRVGAVHAGANTVALGLFAISLRARRRGDHLRGMVLGIGGSAAATVGGYLGGHLVAARHVASRDPAFDDG